MGCWRSVGSEEGRFEVEGGLGVEKGDGPAMTETG